MSSSGNTTRLCVEYPIWRQLITRLAAEEKVTSLKGDGHNLNNSSSAECELHHSPVALDPPMVSAQTDSTVTVVIPCFNQAQYLSAAVQSVRIQSYQPIECMVVDDGSTDGTGAVAASLGVKVIQQANSGVSMSRNSGLAASQGELIVFLDADDELLPDGLAREVEALRSNPNATAVVGRCEAMDGEGHPLSVDHHAIDPSNLYCEWLSKNFVWTSGAAMFRRRELLALGGFPAALGPAADYAVYLRLARMGRVVFLPANIARYRQHDASMSRDPALMLRDTLEALRRERRAAPSSARAHIRRGRSRWCAWYGEQIVHRLRQDWQARRRGRAQVRAALTVLRHCPGLVLQHGVRKTRRTLSAVLRHIIHVSSTLGRVPR